MYPCDFYSQDCIHLQSVLSGSLRKCIQHHNLLCASKHVFSYVSVSGNSDDRFGTDKRLWHELFYVPKVGQHAETPDHRVDTDWPQDES